MVEKWALKQNPNTVSVALDLLHFYKRASRMGFKLSDTRLNEFIIISTKAHDPASPRGPPASCAIPVSSSASIVRCQGQPTVCGGSVPTAAGPPSRPVAASLPQGLERKSAVEARAGSACGQMNHLPTRSS